MPDNSHPMPGRVAAATRVAVDIDPEQPLRDAAGTPALLAAIVESSDDAIIGKDLDGLIRSWNSGAERMYGYAAAEVIGRSVSLLVPPGRENDVPSLLARIRRGERIQHYETVRQAKDGRTLLVSLTISPIRNYRGELIGASAVARDITDRKRAESRWRLLADVGDTLVQALEAEEVLRGIARLLVRDLADYSVTYLVEDGAIRRVAAAHADPAGEPLLERLLDQAPPTLDDEYGAGAVIRSGKPVLADHVADDMLTRVAEDPQYLQLLRELRPVSSLIVPLRVGERVIGAMALASTPRSNRHYAEADVILCREIADRVALSLDNARLYVQARDEIGRRRKVEAELQRRYERLAVLYDMTAAVGGSGVLAEIYDLALDGLRRTIGVERASILLFDEEGVMRFQAWRGLSDEYRRAVEGHSPWTRDARDPQPFGIPDIAADDALEPDLRATIEAESIRSLVFVPLVFQGQLLGKFMLYFDAPRVLDAEELELTWTIAGTIAVAIVRARDQEQVREARHVAERASAAKSQFLGIMSHELRTPLNAILGYSELLLLEAAGPLTADQKRQLERIQSSARHQVGLVDEVLTYARLDAGHEQLHVQSVDARDIATEAVDLVRIQAELRGLRIELRVPETPLLVRTDAERLRQILLNLVGNAAKYTESGVVTVSATRDGSELVLTISDTGPGIPEDQLEYIFAPFTRVDESRTRITPGTGLGLAIVRRLTRLLGGDVSVESVLGEGSTFTVRVPVDTPSDGTA
jgi:PAS domain S-box-containing protein